MFFLFFFLWFCFLVLKCCPHSDGHDKPFCTKAITIIDNFKKALGDTDDQ